MNTNDSAPASGSRPVDAQTKLPFNSSRAPLSKNYQFRDAWKKMMVVSKITSLIKVFFGGARLIPTSLVTLFILLCFFSVTAVGTYITEESSDLLLKSGCFKRENYTNIKFKQSCLSEGADGYFSFSNSLIHVCQINKLNDSLEEHRFGRSRVELAVPLSDLIILNSNQESIKKNIVRITLLGGGEKISDTGCLPKGDLIELNKYLQGIKKNGTSYEQIVNISPNEFVIHNAHLKDGKISSNLYVKTNNKNQIKYVFDCRVGKKWRTCANSGNTILDGEYTYTVLVDKEDSKYLFKIMDAIPSFLETRYFNLKKER